MSAKRVRAATPNAILKKRGSSRARKNEPDYSGGFGAPPSTLTGAALEAWEITAKELEGVGLGSSIEREALACYCEAIKAFHQANEDIERLGSVVESERGFTRNPACLNQNAAMGMILKFAIQFGMTPASRKGIEGKTKKSRNPIADL